jgi:hypothetical protein
MRTAIIVNDIDNLPLLRFTETKLFFDAKNQGIDYVDDCVVVDTFDEAHSIAEQCESSVILKTGDFLTTTFRNNNATSSICYADGPDIIRFASDTYVGFSKRCHYEQGSKQLYIIENFLKTYLRSRKLVYLDNTESMAMPVVGAVKHLYGLASGWKTILLADHIGFDNLESITVYDYTPNQLSHAQWIHQHVAEPICPTYTNVCGEYKPDSISVELWQRWKEYPVKFEQINLFDTPVFPEQSLVWVSNVFRYEPNIFDFGWETCKNRKKELADNNAQSYII